MEKVESSARVAKDGRGFVIRSVCIEDAAALLHFGRTQAIPCEFSVLTIEEFSSNVSQQRKWIETLLQHPGDLGLVAEIDGEIVALLDFHQKRPQRLCHIGAFSIFVHQDYRCIGIGFALIETMLSWAKANGQIEKVSLGVFSNNDRAIHLYKKLGFKQEGHELNAVKLGHQTYADDILMYQFV